MNLKELICKYTFSETAVEEHNLWTELRETEREKDEPVEKTSWL